RRVIRSERGLIFPVLCLIKRIQPDVRHEQPGIDIDAIPFVEVVTCVRFTDVSINVGQFVLTAIRTKIISRYYGGPGSELRHKSCPNIVHTKITTEVQSRQL